MQQQRRTLKLKTAGEDAPGGTAEPLALIKLAIARKLCILATYNRTAMTIAPHILYTKHDEPHLDGVVIARGGVPPKELKLGTFKLTGLSGLGLSPDSFMPQAVYDAATERYVGTTIATV